MSNVVRLLTHEYPDSRCSLNYENLFQLLVATILSAQCTDDRVNKVTRGLFSKYPSARDCTALPLETIKKEKPTGIKGDFILSAFLTSTMGISYKLKLGK